MKFFRTFSSWPWLSLFLHKYDETIFHCTNNIKNALQIFFVSAERKKNKNRKICNNSFFSHLLFFPSFHVPEYWLHPHIYQINRCNPEYAWDRKEDIRHIWNVSNHQVTFIDHQRVIHFLKWHKNRIQLFKVLPFEKTQVDLVFCKLQYLFLEPSIRFLFKFDFKWLCEKWLPS